MHRNVDLERIDFVFGGSTLEMLAQSDATDPYMVTCVAKDDSADTHRTILITKAKEYIKKLSDVGFQFE